MNRRTLLTTGLALGVLRTVQNQGAAQGALGKNTPRVLNIPSGAADDQKKKDAHICAMAILMLNPEYQKDLDKDYAYTIFKTYNVDASVFVAVSKSANRKALLDGLNNFRTAYRSVAGPIVGGTVAPDSGDPYPDDECPYPEIISTAVKALTTNYHVAAKANTKAKAK